MGAPAKSFSRDEIVRLSTEGRAWDFLTIGSQALKIAPGDIGLRFLAAANLAKLGLRGPALEQLDLLTGPAADDARVSALRNAISALGPCDIPAGEIIAQCLANLKALGPRAADLLPHLPAWKARAASQTWVRARDGNILRRAGDASPEDVTAWFPLSDQRGAALAFASRELSAGPIGKPSIIEGLDPPWWLMEMCKAAAPRADGFRPRITVVQSDPLQALDGLAQADLVEWLADQRVELLAGPDASERLGALLRSRAEARIQGPLLPVATCRPRLSPTVDRVVAEALGHQAREVESRAEAVRRLYAGRDAAWWRDRYRAALSGVGPPLRVLVPTCRFSTFVRHSSGDLVAAMRRLGWQAELLIEPDASSHMSTLAYHSAIERLQPDLIVLINYTRANMSAAFPAEVPFVCWVQDCMPHLHDSRIGAAQGPLDFLAGHLPVELFRDHGYPLERLVPAPVVADDAKFHPEPVPSSLRCAHECDIALVTHHSETPEQFHQRSIRECGGDDRLRRACEAMRPRIEHAMLQRASDLTVSALHEVETAAKEEAIAVFGPSPDARAVTTLRRVYALAYADRLIRHQAITWAVDAARANSWRLHLYGRGWDRHPDFAPFARGELDHGEPLRAAYQCAGVTIHVSSNTLVHQRVMECALSGGLPICRVHGDALAPIYGWAQDAALRRDGWRAAQSTEDLVHLPLADHPEFVSVAMQLQRLGVERMKFITIRPDRARSLRDLSPRCDHLSQAAWLLGDLSETTFHTAEGLTRRIRHALDHPEWRANVSRAIAARVRQRLTHAALATRIADLVRSSLEIQRPAREAA